MRGGSGINTSYRRLYYNPDGNGRDGEFDFITYFECADEHVGTFDHVCRSLRDERQNPEWSFVEEGTSVARPARPEIAGRRLTRLRANPSQRLG